MWMTAIARIFLALNLLVAVPVSTAQLAQRAFADKHRDAEIKLDRYGDPLPTGALMRLGTIRFQHGKGIESAALSPDGKILVTAGGDAIRVWDSATGRPLRHYELLSMPRGFGSGSGFLVISPDGKTLACAGEDPKVRFWDMATGVSTGELDVSDKGRVSPRSIAYSPDGKHMALAMSWFAGQTPDVSLWEIATGKKVLAFPNTGSIVEFTPDSKGLIVKGDDEKSVALVSPENGQRMRVFVHGTGILWVACSADGKSLATAGTDKTVRIWEVATGNERFAFVHPLPETSRPDSGWITSVAFSVDGRILASVGVDRIIRLWELQTGKEIRALRGHTNFVTRLLFAPGGQTLYSVSWDGTVKRWELDTGIQVAAPRPATSDHRMALSPDGKLIAIGQYGLIKVIETTTVRERHAIEVPEAKFVALEFSPNGKFLGSSSLDGVVRVWNVATCELSHTLGETKRDSKFRQCRLAFAPDGGTAAVAYRDEGKVRLWEITTGRQLREFEYPDADPIAFAPDGRTIAVSGMRGKIILWDPVTGQERMRLGDEQTGADALAFSPDSKILASSHRDFRNTIRLWEVRTGRFIRGWRVPQRIVPSMMVGSSEIVWSLTFTPDGLELLTACLDGSLRAYDPESGKELLKLDGHKGWVMSVSAGRDARTAWTGSMDGTALLWDLRPSDPPLPDGQLETLWNSLAGEGVVAHRAMWALVEHPAESVALLRERLRPAPLPPPVDAKKVEKWLTELDSSEFAVREAASKGLAELGAAIEPQLKKKLAANPPLEMRKRLEALLDRLPNDRDTPETLRQRRTVRVLEQIGSQDARDLLRKLSSGAPNGRLTWAAKAALQRLEGNTSK
jgi:WD40 repeat protein